MIDNLRFFGRHRSGVAEVTEATITAAVVNTSESFITVIRAGRRLCFEEFTEEEILV